MRQDWRAWLVAVVAVVAAAQVARSEPAAALDVQVATGRLHGVRTPADADAWYGIPYAAPPVGARRWRAPAPAPAWPGTREALRPGPPCPQPAVDSTGHPTVAGSEDCLTLNVFRPADATAERLPVMVWIHGGGQLYGTGATYDGSRLARHERVIVVTINYRLGPLGWFHHPAITGEGAGRRTGQFGLLDAIAALRWVRQNIAAFGGDPGRVTLFGESAGAQNVYALLFAPAAGGLFQRAIAESGGFWNMDLDQAVNRRDDRRPGTPLSAREAVDALLVATGRAADRAAAGRLQSGQSPRALAAWLRGLDPATLLSVYRNAPHLEYDFPSVVYDGVLLPRQDHRTLLAQRRYAPVPLLVGGNRDEQKAFLWSDPGFVRTDGDRLTVRDAAHYATVSRLYSDWWNFTAVDDLLDRLHTPVYAYRFEWDDEPTEPSDLQTLFGSAHGLELAFVFGDFRFQFVHDELPTEDGAAAAGPLAGLFHSGNTASRERTSAAMMAYWGAFARDGRPGRGGRDDLPEWTPWAEGQRKLVFGNGDWHWDATRLREDELENALSSSPGLSAEERCAILLDNLMYPRYPARRLRERGCAR